MLPPINAALACDCHFHVFNAHEAMPGARYTPHYSATLEAWKEKVLLKRGVLVQPSFLGTHNQLLLRTLASESNLLRGVAVVDEKISLNELHELHAAGVRAVRLNLVGKIDAVAVLRALSSSWWRNLLLSQLHLELHAENGGIAALIPHLPLEIKVVFDHFAKAQQASLYDATVQAMRKRQRAGGVSYVTLSGAYRLENNGAEQANSLTMALAQVWRDELGSQQLLWASDWPCTNHETQVNAALPHATLMQWLPKVIEQEAALIHNPAALYWP